MINGEFDTTSEDGVEEEPRLETNRYMVQSIKTLRDHRLNPMGTSPKATAELEESASYGNIDQIREGLFVNTVVFFDVDQLTKLIEEDVSQGASMWESIIRAIRKTSQTKHANDLVKGKSKRALTDISKDNVTTPKRQKIKWL